MIRGWKLVLGTVLIGSGTILTIFPGLDTIGKAVQAAGVVLVGVGAEHKSRKIDEKIDGLEKQLPTP